MTDVLAIAGTVVVFVVLALMAAGCDRLIGPSGDDAVPGGRDEQGPQ